MIDELAPHQAALAEMLGKRAPSPAQPIRDGWLTELRHDPARALDGLARTVAEHRGDAAQSAMLARLAMQFSENHDRAEPEPAYRPCGAPGPRVNLARDGKPIRVTLGAETGKAAMEWLCDEHREGLAGGKLQAVLAPGGGTGVCDWPVRPAAWCDYCGATTDLQETDELGTGDRPCACHGMLTRPCRDTEACNQRREERYPPDLSRVPDWIFTAQQRISDATSRQMILAACGAALSDYLALVAREDEEAELQLAAQQEFTGWQATPGGAWDTRGGWHPSQPSLNFNWSHWAHTIGGHPSNRSHLISGNGLTPARISAMAAVTAARGAQAASDGAQDGGGHSPARREIPPVGVPENVRQALDGDHQGGDIPMAPASAAVPQRPAPRPRRPQYGRRAFPKRVLKYSGR